MAPTMQAAALLLLTFLFYLYRRFSKSEQDIMEPPSLQHRIPLIGHIIGMIWGKADYYVQLRCTVHPSTKQHTPN